MCIYTDDTCNEWMVRVDDNGDCIEYCNVDKKDLTPEKDCNHYRFPNKFIQEKLI